MKLTKIALALVAVLAMSAMTASAASAVTYNANAANAMLFGKQSATHKFTVTGQPVECKVAEFEVANVASGANEVKPVVATYKECTAFGFPATVNMGTCTYRFAEPNNEDEVNLPGVPMGKVGVSCNNNADVNTLPNNGDIRVFSTVFGSECEVHVEEQATKHTVSYTNNTPSAGKVRLDAEVTFLIATINKDNNLCPLAGNKNSAVITANATYNGATDVEGTGGAGIFVS